jgi:Na+/proline symporter
MSPALLLAIVFGYFLVLLGIAWYTARGAGEHSFYSGDRKSLWYVVAFGMIGTSLSGVTFISVPGYVDAKAWTYFQLVLGFAIGYWVVAGVLLPLYYRMKLTSIYGYLRERFGLHSYRTGASFFILSRLAGATIRIFVVLNVIHLFVLKAMGIPFEVTAFAVMVMIVLYTLKGGVKTIVWTDTLQTLFMLGALIGTVVYIVQQPGLGDWLPDVEGQRQHAHPGPGLAQRQLFLKQILAGIFITIAMTGLDQEMMQKNLSVSTVEGSKKNMRVFSVILLGVNLLFLLLGSCCTCTSNATGFRFPPIRMTFFPPCLAAFPTVAGAVVHHWPHQRTLPQRGWRAYGAHSQHLHRPHRHPRPGLGRGQAEARASTGPFGHGGAVPAIHSLLPLVGHAYGDQDAVRYRRLHLWALAWLVCFRHLFQSLAAGALGAVGVHSGAHHHLFHPDVFAGAFLRLQDGL